MPWRGSEGEAERLSNISDCDFNIDPWGASASDDAEEERGGCRPVGLCSRT